MFLLERGSKTIESRVPNFSVFGKPRIELPEWLGFQGIKAALPIRSHRYETCLVQNTEMPRDPGLMDPGIDNNVANLVLAAAQRFDNATTSWVSENLEDV